MTLAEFIDSKQISLSCRRIADDKGAARGVVRWSCQLHKPDTAPLSFYYTHGPAHAHRKPRITNVLNSLANDAANFDVAPESFETWAEIHGRNVDSRAEERLYHELGIQAQALRNFLGPDSYWVLLHKVARHRAP